MTVYDLTIYAAATGWLTVTADSEDEACRIAVEDLYREIDWQDFDNLEVAAIEGREDA